MGSLCPSQHERTGVGYRTGSEGRSRPAASRSRTQPDNSYVTSWVHTASGHRSHQRSPPNPHALSGSTSKGKVGSRSWSLSTLPPAPGYHSGFQYRGALEVIPAMRACCRFPNS